MKLGRILLIFLVLSCSAALAEDAYYHVALTALTLSEGKLPDSSTWNSSGWQMLEAFQPYAVLDGEGEALVSGNGTFNPWQPRETLYRETFLALRVPKDGPVTGRLFVPKSDLSGMVALKFKVDTASAKADAKQEFFKAKENYYRMLRERNIPGGAWFRHQEIEAAKARGAKVAPAATTPAFNPGRRRSWDDGYDSTYNLFSGGRALSENLQLDRLMAAGPSNSTVVAISNLTGITVREMNWKSLLSEHKPALDPLATHIPFDQHALFFSSFGAMSHWIDEADQDGTPVLQMYEPRAEDANSRGRYQKQLCLELSELSRLLGPQLIASVAFTGSDPYLRTGTDLGVLYESTAPAALKTFIQARHAAAQQANPGVRAVKGNIEGVAYTGVVSDDRSVSSYVAALDDVVLVSNSRAQLERLISVAKGKTPALASQDEYVYFRQKYPRTAPAETGFLVLSDATIRRWCGPQWRIANSRRTRAAAALAELQAAHLDELASGQAKPGCVATNLPEIGDVLLTTNGVLSTTYGTLDFLTPVIELPLTQVTRTEADTYSRWRDGYQQNWSQYFDPIAVRFSITAQRLSAELTVMPLIAGSEYRHFIDISSGAHIAAEAGDPHPETLAHLALALNAQSESIKQSGNFLGNFSPSLKANPLGWLGQCLAIYADQDPFWTELAKASKSSDFLEKNYPRLPVAVYCEVKSALGVTAFLTAVRAFAEQTAPRMSTWENLEYNGQAYVKITAPQEQGDEGGAPNLCVYYAVTPKSLVLTLSETVLKRALDRQHAQLAEKQAGKTDSAPANPWLGTNLCLRIDQSFVPTLEMLFNDQFRPAQQRLAWSNIPILNEWKRRYPQKDPVKLHEQFWQTTLVCPGGGRYVWNEQWQTMESTVYGHPAQPKPGPERLLPMGNITSANLGVTFENQGLSANAVLERNGSKAVR
ncbi:MAG TPA: hypothetical protein VN578_19180 [Candidatus Binatia bacterium]|jgi:hypothetical protein|nr:hypothetical protein [Candidatus Binatia bacterium]